MLAMSFAVEGYFSNPCWVSGVGVLRFVRSVSRFLGWYFNCWRLLPALILVSSRCPLSIRVCRYSTWNTLGPVGVVSNCSGSFCVWMSVNNLVSVNLKLGGRYASCRTVGLIILFLVFCVKYFSWRVGSHVGLFWNVQIYFSLWKLQEYLSLFTWENKLLEIALQEEIII